MTDYTTIIDGSIFLALTALASWLGEPPPIAVAQSQPSHVQTRKEMKLHQILRDQDSFKRRVKFNSYAHILGTVYEKQDFGLLENLTDTQQN